MRKLRERYGSTALITGASSGIGLAFAEALAKEGLNLILVARRRERLEALAVKVRSEHGVQATVIPLDLALRESAAMLEAELKRSGATVDILVNNAGFGLLGKFEQHERARELEMVDLNCRAVVDLTHRLLPHMLERKRGAIVIVSSVVAVFPTPWFSTYAATKAFDLVFGEALAGELRGTGVDVTVVQPGLTKTEFQASTGMSREFPVSGRPAEAVVRTTLSALGRRASTVDGFMNWAAVQFPRLVPRGVLRGILRGVMKGQLP